MFLSYLSSEKLWFFSAGLQPGDIVTEVNGQKIEGASSIYKILETADSLKMTVFRQRQKINITVAPESFMWIENPVELKIDLSLLTWGFFLRYIYINA